MRPAKYKSQPVACGCGTYWCPRPFCEFEADVESRVRTHIRAKNNCRKNNALTTCGCGAIKNRDGDQETVQCNTCNTFWCVLPNCTVENPNRNKIEAHISAEHRVVLPEALRIDNCACGAEKSGFAATDRCQQCLRYWCTAHRCTFQDHNNSIITKHMTKNHKSRFLL